MKHHPFHAYVVHDVLKGIHGITSRAMFGGWGIYQHGVIFAIIAEGELYFKVGESNRKDFEKRGSHPFVYSQGRHRPTTMSYWRLPEEIFEDREQLAGWVDRSVKISQQRKKNIRVGQTCATFLMLGSVLAAASPASDGLFHDVSQFLKQHVKEGKVAYRAIREQPEVLTRIVERLAALDPSDFWEMKDQKALRINAYNILVIHTVVRHYPTTSPREIPGFFNRLTHRIGGRTLTLDELERVLRKDADPRIHFALVCGAKSCPNLTEEAFTEQELDAQLEWRTRAVANDPAFVRVDPVAQTVALSEIFQWYRDDFLVMGGTLLEYLNRYRDEKIPLSYAVTVIPYSWALNDISPDSDPVQSRLQRYTFTTLLQPGQWELKIFHNLYTQTAFFDTASLIVDQAQRSTYFTASFSWWLGLSSDFTIGLDAFLKSVRLDARESSPFAVFRFGSDTQSHTAVTSVGPKLRFSPIPSVPGLAVQSSFLIPVTSDLEGLASGKPFLDEDGWQWWVQVLWDRELTSRWWLYLEAGWQWRGDFRLQNSQRSLVTPFKSSVMYFPTKEWNLYVTTELRPSWQGLSWSSYSTQFGLGTKLALTSATELEVLVTTFPLGRNAGAGQTANIGLRILP